MGSNDSIGALWENEEKGFLKGSLTVNGEKVEIICFKNQYKKERRHPDWKIFLSTPKPKEGKEPF